jgi:hypothetical protein
MTSKPYSKGFVALAKNYIKNFGVPELDTYQIQLVLNYKSEERERYISKLYGIDYDEIIGALKAVC